MQGFIQFMRKALKVAISIGKAVVSPLVTVVQQVATGKRVSPLALGITGWRVVVWLAFWAVSTSAVGIPLALVYMVMADLILIASQSVYYATH